MDQQELIKFVNKLNHYKQFDWPRMFVQVEDICHQMLGKDKEVDLLCNVYLFESNILQDRIESSQKYEKIILETEPKSGLELYCFGKYYDVINDIRTAQYAKDSAELDDPFGLNLSGCYYIHGEYGFDVDLHEALRLLKKSCDMGYGIAGYNVHLAYKELEYNGESVDKEEELKYLGLASASEYNDAHFLAGSLSDFLGKSSLSVLYFKRCIESGDSNVNRVSAMKILGEIYCNGVKDVEPDIKQAKKYLKLAKDLAQVTSDVETEFLDQLAQGLQYLEDNYPDL